MDQRRQPDGSPRADGLSPREHREAEERSSPSALVVHEAIRREGEEELARPVPSLAWSGLAAGLAMGLSLVGDGLIRAALPDAPWRPLLTSFGYTLGFLVVVLGRQQLFTENTLTGVVPVLHRMDGRSLAALAKLWSVVFIANVVGTILFAATVASTSMFDEEARRAFHEIGTHAAEPDFWTTFLRAIPAGWLIALMVWLLPAAGSARLLVIIVITYFVALGDLAHVIAGSAEVAYVTVLGAVSWREYLIGFLVPAFLGNTIGGAVLVAAINHAQVRREV